jgi:hypothetical protein
MGQHFLSLAAEQQALHAPPSVGSHDDEIAFFFFGGLDYGFVGLIAGFLSGFARYPRFFGRLFDREEVFVHFRLDCCFSLLLEYRREFRIVTEVAQFG